MLQWTTATSPVRFRHAVHTRPHPGLESVGVSVIQAICPHRVDRHFVFVVKGSNFDLQARLALMDQAIPTAGRSVVGGKANIAGV